MSNLKIMKAKGFLFNEEIFEEDKEFLCVQWAKTLARRQ
jgi:hypothetical protein